MVADRVIRLFFSFGGLLLVVLGIFGGAVMPERTDEMAEAPDPTTQVAPQEELKIWCVNDDGEVLSCQSIQTEKRAGIPAAPQPVERARVRQEEPRCVNSIGALISCNVQPVSRSAQPSQQHVQPLGQGRIQGSTAYLSDGRVIHNFDPHKPYFNSPGGYDGWDGRVYR